MLDAMARWLLDPSGLTPHGFCLLWDPGLIWLHAVSDGATGLAYFAIPVALAVFASRRRELAFRPMSILFAAFILLCGTGHWLDLLTLWVPVYWIEGLVKLATALVSIPTAVVVWLLLPQASVLPSPRQLREANDALTERARDLARLNAELEQFAYIASHDLKAPLNAVARLAEWVKHDIESTAGKETLENMSLIQQRVSRLDMLLASLLNYVRVGHAKAPAETLDIAELVRDITASISPPAGFLVRFRGDVPKISAHRSPLEHVLRNLISNAIKHHDLQAGEITVSVRVVNGITEFQVEDDGPGIDPRFHDRIFKMFHTLQSRDVHETSGVGLAIVQKLVEQAGGRVWVNSTPPTRGTIILFTWPVGVAVKTSTQAA